MDGIKLEFNDILILYMKNDFECRRFVSLGYFIVLCYINYILLLFLKKNVPRYF